VNTEGHDAYLLGRYFFNRPSDDNLRKAIAQFEKSVALNPGFAAGYSGLSDAYLWAGYNEGFLTASAGKVKSKAAAERAVQLDSNSAEAHTSLATYMLFYDKDWPACEREYRRAIALNANYAFVTAYLAYALGAAGDRAGAMRELESLRKVSPDGKVLPFNLALVHLGLGDRARALDNLEKAYDADSQLLAWLGQDAVFDSLRSEPRFVELLRKLNFVK
jgi:tetratricopeptide (TPR) repeat protein